MTMDQWVTPLDVPIWHLSMSALLMRCRMASSTYLVTNMCIPEPLEYLLLVYLAM